MDDSIARIRAAIDVDERDAKDRRGIWPHPGVTEGVSVWLHLHRNGNAIVTSYLPGEAGWGDAARLREWCEPEGEGWHRDRVLRQVAAYRKILELHQIERIEPTLNIYDGRMRWPRGRWRCSVCSEWRDGEQVYDDGVACPTLLALAEVYGIES